MHEVDPKGVEDRRLRRLHKRGRYGIPGPNRVWSIDGHDKLSRFGFEIYACIDAYSRCIIWCYVGHSNRTAVSVMKQYLLTIKHMRKYPKLVRSDCGTETVLLCRAHLVLRRAGNPDLAFQKIYSFGTSTRNQRIEAWWRLLAEGKTDTFRSLFEKLEQDNLFNGGAIDVTAMQFIYMDIIRQSVHDFVQVHNIHRIRHQRHREAYLPTGHPIELFEHPPTGVQDYGMEPPDFLLNELLKEVEAYDLDEYLTENTKTLCQNILLASNLPTHYTFADDHVRAYLVLCEGLARYCHATGNDIELLPKPIGSAQWIEEQREVHDAMEQHDQQQSHTQENDLDFLLYQTENESEDLVNAYNQGRDYQLARAYPHGNRDIEEENECSRSGSDSEDDDGIVYLL